MKVSTFFWTALGILLFATVIALLVKVSEYSPIYAAIGILLTAVLSLVVLAVRMATTQRVKAKGAKKRRKKVLPMFFRKKKRKMSKARGKPH